MSGGHFNYDQYSIGYIADAIEEVIATNDDKSLDQWGHPKGRWYSGATIERFREAVCALRQAQWMAQRIDWLLSCDDSEESFHERWDQHCNE